jgi:hypothetical protein
MKAFVLGVMGARVDLEGFLSAIRKLQSEKIKKGEAYLLYGDFDTIAKFEGDRNGLELLLMTMSFHGVADTNTIIVDESGMNYEVEGCDSIRKAAYILLKSVRPTNLSAWQSILKQIEDVTEFHEIYGAYDVLVSVREEARHDFLRRVLKPIRSLTKYGLIATNTLFTIETL